MSRIGTVEVTTERLMANNKTIYNTAEDFFEKIGPREKWPSSGFEKLLIFAVTRLSTRETSTLIEMVSGGPNRIIPTTVRNHLESHGLQMVTLISKTAEEALNSEDIKAAFE
jgi:hypothetical protein